VSDETRCAVCGLNEIETEQLREDTGESLGGYFTCDGNCGNIFHVRCAGEIGEGGQYTVPSGEWYCTTCSVLDDENESEIRDNLNLIPLSTKDESTELTVGDQVLDGSDLPNSQQLRLLSEYHKIRRERNRILNQWQHEQRLLKQRNDWRDKKEFELNQELISAKEIINKLQDNMCGHLRERNSLERRLSEAVNELILLKNERIKFSHLSVSTSDASTSTERITGQGTLVLSPSVSIVSNQSLRSALQNPYSVSAPSTEIPKPWLKKSTIKKSVSSDPSLLESELSPDKTPSLGDQEIPLPLSKKNNRLTTSPIRQHSSSYTPQHSLDSTSMVLTSIETSDLLRPTTSLASLSSTKSPFNKRLINLIQIVKEETGSFAEIRKKYKERESERTILKSRHQIPPVGSKGDIEGNKERMYRSHDELNSFQEGHTLDEWTTFPSL
jgi:hypothetical protein